MRDTRETLHMLTAVIWATRSTCKRLKVGAVVTSLDYKKQLSVGYNGPAPGIPNDSCDGQEGNCGCYHAEVNALNRVHPYGGDLVVFTTAMPCTGCAQKMIKSGVRTVWYLSNYRDHSGISLLMSEGIAVHRTNRAELRSFVVDLLPSILKPQD